MREQHSRKGIQFFYLPLRTAGSYAQHAAAQIYARSLVRCWSASGAPRGSRGWPRTSSGTCKNVLLFKCSTCSGISESWPCMSSLSTWSLLILYPRTFFSRSSVTSTVFMSFGVLYLRASGSTKSSSNGGSFSYNKHLSRSWFE